jgi:hypothetical protein
MRHNDSSREPLTIGEAEAKRTTDKAVLVWLLDDGEEIWVPKSVIHEDSEVHDTGDAGDLIVQRWWAEANGLDY